jgi:hypothetical protein
MGFPLELIELPSGKRRTEPFRPCVPPSLAQLGPLEAALLQDADLLFSLLDSVRG